MRVLITGVNGFVGPWVASNLLEREPGTEVWGMAWGPSGREPLTPLAPRLRVVDADLTEPDRLGVILDDIRPDVVLHLAAASSVAGSWSSPARVLEVNALGQIHLFEALLEVSGKAPPVVVVASSAEVYGRVPKEHLPVREDAPLAPVSPYGVSKAAQDLLAWQYHVARRLHTVRLRLFNHTGPRRPPHFFASSFARQIADIERGRRPARLQVGSLEVVRDLSDVRDVAEAWRLAARHGAPGGVYNVCSGRGVKVGEVLRQLLALAEVDVEVEEDPDLLRPSDIPVLVGDPTRLRTATGWRGRIPLEQTLGDLLQWWRDQG